ncbi:MAG: tetratricopeptide repeat protein, partial [bacterium]|nr:tetratricopeptide repeat protein [bacterium]
MAKRVNKNMVAALTAFGFVLMAVAGVVMILQLRQTDPARFTEMAQAHEDEGAWEEALTFYNKAYLVSNDPVYLVDVGRMYFNQGEEDRARAIWEMAVTNDPTLEPALTKLCEYYYEGARRSRHPSWWRPLLETADDLLKLDDQNAYALSLRGQARFALRKAEEIEPEDALADLTRAVEIAPENVDYALALASIQSSFEGKRQDAESLYERLMEANTTPGRDAARIRSAYADKITWLAAQAGQADLATKQLARAEELHQAAIDLAGDDPDTRSDVRVRMADYLIDTHLLRLALRQPEPTPEAQAAATRAEALLVEAIEIQPDGFGHCLLLAELYKLERKYTDMVRVCDTRIQRGIERKGLKGFERKQGLYLTLLAAADGCIVQASALQMESPERADLLTKAQEWVVEAKAERPTAPEALRTDGRILLAQRKDLEALAAFEKADKLFARPDAENKWYLAQLYLSQNQIGAARRAMEAAIRTRQVTARDWITYARILLQSNMTQRAVDAAEQALRMDPDDRTARLVLLEAYHKLGRQDLIDRTLAELDADDPTNLLVRAQALALQDKHAEAVAVLAPLLEKEPGNVTAVTNAFQSYMALEDLAQAKAVVEKGLAVAPTDLTLQRLALLVDPDLTDEERDQRHLAVLNDIEDDYLRATELARYYVNVATPDDETQQANLVEAEAQLVQAQKLLDEMATPVVREQVKVQGAGALHEIMERRFVVAYTRQDLEQADRIAEEARTRNVDGVNGLTYTGRLHLLRKNPELAVESFRQALELAPNSSQTLYLLAGA